MRDRNVGRRPRFSSGLLALAALLALAGRPGATNYTFSWSLPTPQGNPLTAIAFESDDLHGYAVGDFGTVLATSDGGATWSFRSDTALFTQALNDLLVLAPGELLAVGGSPGVFHSSDAGATWQAVSNPSSAELIDLSRVDASTLVAVGKSGQVIRSLDDGLSWTLRPSPLNATLNRSLWLDANNGYVGGINCARRTTNGGNSWSTLPGGSESGEFTEIFVSTPGDISLLSDFSTVRSTNNGVSWTTTTVPNELVYQSTTLVYSPQHRIISVRVEGAVLLETFDDGANWEVILADFDSGGFGDLTRLSDGTLLAVTDDGDLWRSTDQGVNWSNATRSPDDEPRVTISALAADANGRVFAGSSQPGQSYRRFHKSTDGGDSFGKVPEPAINFMNALAYTPGNLLLAGGSGATASRVWRSTDEAASWTQHVLPNSFSNGVQVFDFATPSAGEYFAAGYGNTGSAIFWSTDSGVTWAQRTTGIPTNTFLTSVDFVNDQLGFAAGGSTNSARIWKTTNAGASWTSVGTTGIGDFIFDLHWFDAQNGLASCYAQVTGIFRTTNGGAGWTKVANQASRYFSFWDASRGYCTVSTISPTTPVLETTDGGASWSTVQVPSTRGAERVLALADGFLVSGTRSAIIRAHAAPPVAVDPIAPFEVPDSAVLLRAVGSAGPLPAIEFRLPRDMARIAFNLRSSGAPREGPHGRSLRGRRVASPGVGRSRCGRTCRPGRRLLRAAPDRR